jgi:hypothetical protein
VLVAVGIADRDEVRGGGVARMEAAGVREVLGLLAIEVESDREVDFLARCSGGSEHHCDDAVSRHEAQ